MGTFCRDITVIWGGKKCHYTDLGFVLPAGPLYSYEIPIPIYLCLLLSYPYPLCNRACVRATLWEWEMGGTR
jgi:hypothetical protein